MNAKSKKKYWVIGGILALLLTLIFSANYRVSSIKDSVRWAFEKGGWITFKRYGLIDECPKSTQLHLSAFFGYDSVVVKLIGCDITDLSGLVGIKGITEIALGLMDIKSLESLYKLDLSKLKKLDITGTGITRDDALEFKKKYPECLVEFDGEVL